MDAKTYLGQARRIHWIIESKLLQIQQLENLATQAKCPMGKIGEAGGSSIEGSRVESLTVKFIDLKDQVEADIKRLLDLRSEIGAAIKEIGNLEFEQILEARYLNYKSWNELCDGMKVSKDYLYHLHGKALKMIKVPDSSDARKA